MTLASLSNTPAATAIGQAHSSHPQLEALLHGAGIAPLDRTGWIRVSGEDRARWLNGMATNSVQQLAEGTGTYNFFLNAQGRIQADGNVFATSDDLLIETSRSQIATLIAYLDHYIIMDDVELADVSDTQHGLTLAGPLAASLLAQIGLAPEGFKELEARKLQWNSATITLIRIYGPLVPRYELWSDSAETVEALRKGLEDSGAVSCEPGSMEWLRILEGTPLYGTDIRDRDLPQETNQNRALHFSKGCYLGQEIVERIRSRGSVHRTFTAFRLEGALPAPGTAIESRGKAVGELTSVAEIQLDGSRQFALGYVRREALERREPLQYPGGTARAVSSLFSVTETDSSSPASDN
jgi:folate-binding protein YgfZ